MTIPKNSPVKRFNQVLLFVVLLFVILHYAKAFLIPIAISGLMAMLLVPVCRRLEKWKIARGIAASISVFITLLLILGVLYLLVDQLVTLSKDFSVITGKFKEMLNSIHNYISQHFQLSVAKQKEYLTDNVDKFADAAGKHISRTFLSVISLLVNILIITTYTLLMLIYRYRIKNFVLQLVNQYAGKKNLADARNVVEEITGVASAYLAGVFSVVLILSVVYTIGLTIIGVENALFFALLAALINIIPYIGSVGGGAIVVAYTLITRDSLTTPLVVIAFFTVVQQVDSYFLTPKITGGRVKLSPLFTIMVLLLGSMVWGVAGMILFIPFLGVAKVVFDHVDSLKPYGYLVGIK